ncbi:MAG: DUF1624 domain-containing protein [Armatimonadetes bacterium]|nr:DUF1624 domain-containing protein [Armatimonadota bacterium]
MSTDPYIDQFGGGDFPQPPPKPLPAASAAGKEPSPAGDRQGTAKPGRLLALDAFRGLTIALMLLVNNIALNTATPAQLTHAPWNSGVRLADFVFPWFLFCVGVAIPFSAASLVRKGVPPWRRDLKILMRAAVLVLLGCLIDSSLSKRLVFTLGVLQIIGLAYLVGAMLYDLPLSRRLWIAGFFLTAYWIVIKFVPIPGAGTGVVQESQNVIRHINDTYLFSIRLAGLPSVVPTAALVLIGTAVGDLLRQESSHLRKMLFLLAGGLGLVAGGALWDMSLPFNKAIWTPSYILLTAGTGSLVLAFLYLLIDANGWRKWPYPLLVFGSNAILAYVAPILVKVLILQEWRVQESPGKTVPALQWLLDVSVAHLGRIAGGWMYTIGYIAVWWLILWQLYRNKVFLRV